MLGQVEVNLVVRLVPGVCAVCRRQRPASSPPERRAESAAASSPVEREGKWERKDGGQSCEAVVVSARAQSQP